MQRILFVCTGNTCRSPMAEAILRNKKIPELEVKSAGIFAANGSDASDHAKKVLMENEMIHEHRSTSITKEEVDWATWILTMTFSHKTAIVQYFPESAKKTFTLKEFTGENDKLDVMDPFGGNMDCYRNTFKELEKLIDAAIDRIKER